MVRVSPTSIKPPRISSGDLISVAQLDTSRRSPSFIYMPKLILVLFGTPSRITFVLQDGLIVVRAVDEKS